MCRAVLQMKGATPLFIACQNGHLECVRALLDEGAAINQAAVGCADSMAHYCGGCVRGVAWEPAGMSVQLVGWAWMQRG